MGIARRLDGRLGEAVDVLDGVQAQALREFGHIDGHVAERPAALRELEVLLPVVVPLDLEGPVLVRLHQVADLDGLRLNLGAISVRDGVQATLVVLE